MRGRLPDTYTLRGLSFEELLAIPLMDIRNGVELRRYREVLADKRPPTPAEVDRYLDALAQAAYRG